MHRIDADAHVGNQFSEGDPGVPTNPTQVDAAWLNGVQGTVIAPIEEQGIALVKGTDTQLAAAMAFLLATPGGRLCASTGTPVPDASVTAATSVFYTPHVHNRIALYDGTRWRAHVFAELSQTLADATKSPAATVANTNYDLFVWNDAGTVRLSRGPAWASASTRGVGALTSELERYEGRHVNKVAITNGPAARRGLYVGSIRTTGANQVEDSTSNRYVWNTYNRVPRHMGVSDATATWTYSTAAWRQANANTANLVNFLIGLSGDLVSAHLAASLNINTANHSGQVSIGLDSITAPAAGANYGIHTGSVTASHSVTVPAQYYGTPAIGSHYFAWLEYTASGTCTFTGGSYSSLLATVDG